MGNQQSIRKINFEDLLFFLKQTDTILINTLEQYKQTCLIKGTLSINEETSILNKYLSTNTNIRIIIYGMNSIDDSTIKKYNQLLQLGFSNIYVYSGGLFEWLLLQEIYGDETFQTTKKELDILQFKGTSILQNKLLIGSMD